MYQQSGTSAGRGVSMLSGLSGVVDILDTVLDESNVDAPFDSTRDESITPSIDILESELALMEKNSDMPSLELDEGVLGETQHEQSAVDDDDDDMDDIMNDFY